MEIDLQFGLQPETNPLFQNIINRTDIRKIGSGKKQFPLKKITDYQNDRIAIPTMEGHEFLFVNKIIRCEAKGNYSEIVYNEDNRKILVCRQLKSIEKVLTKNGFIRIHHSHLINPLYIKKILKTNGGLVELEDGSKIRISKNKEELMEILFHSIKKF